MAEQAQIGVNQEEFTERVLFNAQRAGVSADEYFQKVQENDQLTAIFAEVRRTKALANAVSAATVTDASGNRLDVQALFGFEPVPVEGSVEASAEGDDDAAATDDGNAPADATDASEESPAESTRV
jgi:trigger factor